MISLNPRLRREIRVAPCLPTVPSGERLGIFVSLPPSDAGASNKEQTSVVELSTEGPLRKSALRRRKICGKGFGDHWKKERG